MNIPLPLSKALAQLKYLTAGALLSVLLLWAWHLKHPRMYMLRAVETPLLLMLAICCMAYAAWQLHKHVWFVSRQRWSLILAGGMLLFWLTLFGELRFQYQRHQVRKADAAMQALGQHFIVGFSDWQQLDDLASKGLIGGIYLSGRNIQGLSANAVSARIAHLQTLRAMAQLPPLMVAADQEGGKIEHLSPLLPEMPPLASLAQLHPAAAQAAAYRYGQLQGQGLRELGVNLNLSPVVDLKPAWASAPGDTHTRISQRAIAADQNIVCNVAQSYSRGLQTTGVQATLKHFPGLGSVRQDTHHVAARIDAETAALARDWQPFREVSHSTGAAIMLGHVTLSKLDPAHAVSHSRTVVQQVLRGDWGHQGLLITDDLNMGAVYGRGIGRVSVEALNAGVDLLLVSYDPDQYYRALAAAAAASRKGKMDEQLLRASKARMQVWHQNTARQTYPGSAT